MLKKTSIPTEPSKPSMVNFPVEDGTTSFSLATLKNALKLTISSSVIFLFEKIGPITGLPPPLTHAVLIRGFLEGSANALVRFGARIPPPNAPTPALWHDIHGGPPFVNRFSPVNNAFPVA